ncbi:LacI family DNA-binding transcriptional regulator [Thalassotalea ganghwensis]
MKATINDVAKQAGVSIKTVSRVMNNEPSVRQPTREKVMAVVKELNYQPNLAARNLAGTKAFSIAFIYDNPNAYYVIDMQNGILQACKRLGFELLIHPCSAKSEGLLDEISNMIKHSRIAGLILTPPFSENPEFVKHLLALDIDIVRIMSGDNKPDNLTPCIMVNDFEASLSITQHLIDQGHKEIAFIAGEAEHKSTVERLKGYKQALLNNQLNVDKHLIIRGEYSFESGVEGAKALLSGKSLPSAIMCCNDEIAAGALFASRLLGVAVPEKLAITGFENSPFSRQTWPRLTTADQPTSEIAENAANLLIATSKKQPINHIVTHYTPQLIVRDSTANNA